MPASLSHATSARLRAREGFTVQKVDFHQSRCVLPYRRQGCHVSFKLDVAARPVQPGQIIVLRIGIVVAFLRAPELVARRQHDRAARRKQRRQKARASRCALADDFGIGRLAFDAIVPGQILVVAVTVVLAIGLVVLALIAKQVGQRDAVMRGDEIDAARPRGAISARKYPTSLQVASQARRSCRGRRARNAAHHRETCRSIRGNSAGNSRAGSRQARGPMARRS